MNSPLRRQFIYLSIILFTIISLISHLTVDFYITSTTTAIIESWLESEALNIQQQNYLSSVGKSQRILLSSKFIKGLKLFKVEPRGITELMQIGYNDSSMYLNCTKSKINVRMTGFFSYEFLHCFEGNPEVRIIFYSKNNLFRWAWLTSILLICSFLMTIIYIINYLHKRETAILQILSNMTRQVAHDIRSPITALRIASGKLQSSSEEARIIREASIKIEKIVDDLLQKSKSLVNKQMDKSDETEMVYVSEIIEQISKEKSIQYPGKISLDMSPQSTTVRIIIDKIQIYRAISNLLNNAIEAIDGKQDGIVTIGLRCGTDYIQIIIIDNGKGIPSEILNKIGQNGFTFNKKNGNGLGVSFAKSVIEKSGGTFAINSNFGSGTIQTITFAIKNNIIDK